MLADEAVLSVLSTQLKEGENKPPWLELVFNHVQSFSVEGARVVSVVSGAGEHLSFGKPVKVDGSTVRVLKDVTSMIRKSISQTFSAALKSAMTEPWLTEKWNVSALVEQHLMGPLGQINQMVLRAVWTCLFTAAVNRVAESRFAVLDASREVANLSRMLSEMLRKSAKDGKCTSSLNLQSLVLLVLHLRDTSQALQTDRCRDLTDFQWLSRARVTLDSASAEPRIAILDQSFSYANELIDISKQLFITPLLEKTQVALVLSLNSHQVTCLTGSAGSGRGTSLLSFSNLLAAHLVVRHTSASTTPEMLVNTLEGVKGSHSWLCLADISRLSLQ